MGTKAIKTIRYVDQTTGECHDKTCLVPTQFDEDGYLFWKGRQSIKTYLDRQLPDAFSFADIGRVDVMRRYILKDNQFLVHRCNSVIKPITKTNLGRILQLKDRQLYTFIKKLKTHGIIKEVSFGGLTYFSFNPIYGFKGKRIGITLYVIFQEELNKVLPGWAIAKFTDCARELNPAIQIIK